MKFALLGSGSSGNATLIVGGGATVLIDCGLTFKQLCLRAEAIGQSLDDLDAILITHEHGDHVNGLSVLKKRLNVPVYMSYGTREYLPKKVRDIEGIRPFDSGETIAIGGLSFHSYAVAHDAADPVGYVVQYGNQRLGVAGDMGHVSTLVKQRLRDCHALIVESNYCPDMLLRSPYPPSIRQRIDSRHGHLSNPDACSLINSVAHEGLRLVVLTHLSAENNDPEKVHTMATRAMNGHNAEIHVAWQDKPTQMFTLA